MIVILACGKSSSENNTYLSLGSTTSTPTPSTCVYNLCEINSNICRIRLDFTVRHLRFVRPLRHVFFFVVGLWSQSADKLTIHSIPCSWIFYKPTIPQSPSSHLRDYSTCNNARLEFFHNFCSKLWSKWKVPEKWSP